MCDGVVLQKKENEHRDAENAWKEESYYRHDTVNLMQAEASAHQLEHRIGNVRENIEKNMPQAYDSLKKIRNGEANNKVRLHHSRGTQLFRQGENVLEFDIGGSGFEQFQKRHKGLGGKSNVVKVTAVGKISIKVSELRRLARLSIEQFTKELSKYSNDNPKQREMKKLIIEHIGDYGDGKDLYRDTYGRQEQIKGVKGKKFVLSKARERVAKDGESVTKKKVTMAGPLGAGGKLNIGDYSIENLREYMLKIGQSYLEPVIANWYRLKHSAEQAEADGKMKQHDELMAKIHPVSILLKGHSRGAVAVSHGAMMIKHWLHENYPEFEQYVKFETIQFDPVPGYLSHWNVKQEADIGDTSEKNVNSLKKYNMRPLGESAESTVVYSIHTQHDHLFTPQTLKGAKRVILTPANHFAGLTVVDSTQKNAHVGAYTDAKTGEVYRSSGINALEEGVYIADERQVLVKVTSAAQARSILKSVLKDVGTKQDKRRNRIYEVVDTWFSVHQVQEQNLQNGEKPANEMEGNNGAMKQVRDEKSKANSDDMREGVLGAYDKLALRLKNEENGVNDELKNFGNVFSKKTKIKLKGVDARIGEFTKCMTSNKQDSTQKAEAAATLYRQLENYKRALAQKFESDLYAKYTLQRLIDKLKDYEKVQKNMSTCMDEIRAAMKANKNVFANEYRAYRESISRLSESYNEYRKSRWVVGDSASYKIIGPLLRSYVEACIRTENHIRTKSARKETLPEYVQLSDALHQYIKKRDGASSGYGKERLDIVNKILTGIRRNEQCVENYSAKLEEALV